MKVTFNAAEIYYEVSGDGNKWYSATRRSFGWFVVNHVGRAINQDSAIHRRVVAAIEQAGNGEA